MSVGQDHPLRGEVGLVAVTVAGLAGLSAWVGGRVGWHTRIVSHFDAAGHPNGWMPSGVALSIGVVMAVLMGGGLLVLGARTPALSPKARQTALVVTLGSVLVAHLQIALVALGLADRPVISAPLMVGLLYVLVGNMMGKLRRNRLMGIRLPWTLNDDWVWERTHRLGGRLFVATGLALLALSWVWPGGRWGGAGLLVVVLAPTVAVTVAARHYWTRRPPNTTDRGATDQGAPERDANDRGGGGQWPGVGGPGGGAL